MRFVPDATEFLKFKNAVSKTVSDCIFEYFGVESIVADGSVIETTALWGKPDSMVVYQNGKGILLSDGQKNRICEVFWQMNDQQEGLPLFSHDGLKGIYTAADLYTDMENKLCLEFRYSSRRKFSGSIAECVEHQTDGEPHYMGSTLEYDAILLILWGNGIARMVLFRDGLHSIDSPAHKSLDFGDDYVALYDEVLSLMQ